MTAIYARQSVDKKDSLSIEGQIELCRSECIGDAFMIYKDKGFSGKNTHRPSFEKMIDSVKAGRIQKVVVYRMDRFSRSIADFGRIWEIFQSKGVEFVSINEKFDTSTPMGRAMLYIIMVFAQLERETIAERIRDNYQQRILRGEWAGGSAPFGFDLGRVTEETGKKSPALIPNRQCEIVKHIFETYALPGISLSTVAKELNEEAIPCGKRPAWDSVSVSRILHNTAYVQSATAVRDYFASQGIRGLPPEEAFDGTSACRIEGRRDRAKSRYTQPEEQRVIILNHKGVIPADLWLNCQYKLCHNRQIQNTGKGKHTWLSGLLKCASCGYSAKVSVSKGRKYLSCTGRSNYRICSQSFRLSIIEIEHAVSEEVKALFSGCAGTEQPGDTGQRLREDVSAVETKICRLIGALAEGNSVSVKYINAELLRLDQQKQSLLEQIKQLESFEFKKEPAKFDFEKLQFEEKKAVAFRIIEKILLSSDSLEVIWKL